MAIKYTENPVSCNFQKPSITAEFNMVKFLIFFKIKDNLLFIYSENSNSQKSRWTVSNTTYYYVLLHFLFMLYLTFLNSSRQMKEMKHENLVQIFGACIEPPNICLVFQYCKKGSLKVSEV